MRLAIFMNILRVCKAVPLTLLLLLSCGKSDSESSPSLEPVYLMPGTESDTGPLPELAATIDSNLSFMNFSFSEEEKIQKAVEIIKLVIGTAEFRSRVLNHTYGGKKTFVDNGGYSNAEIYQRILDAAETLRPVKNNMIDGEVQLYFEDTTTIGYTYPGTSRIFVNRKYFSTYSAAGVARNLFHEWLHKLGFTHSASWSVAREYSVPYALGYVMGDIGSDFL